jgi:hypothetical protein
MNEPQVIRESAMLSAFLSVTDTDTHTDTVFKCEGSPEGLSRSQGSGSAEGCL